MPKKKRSGKKKAKSETKVSKIESKKEPEKKPIPKSFYIIAVLGLIVIGFVVFNNKGETIQDKTNTLSERDEILEMFNCEGKNTFQNDCWKKIQVVNEKVVYGVAPGSTLEIKFAFMNREAAPYRFSYNISSLRSADLVRSGCPMPAEADKYIEDGRSEKGLLLESNDIDINTLVIKAPQITTPIAGCSYRYVLEVKKENSFYERDYFDVMIK